MEPQEFEHPPETTLQPSRPQSNDLNAISRTSRAEIPRAWSPFLPLTLFIGFACWVLSLVSQAIIAATNTKFKASDGQIITGNTEVRVLWFGIVIQFIVLLEILEVVISGVFTYGLQISIFAGMATVFAVIGTDGNIYGPNAAQKALGVGWLITAIVDLLWIVYFTSPTESHFIRLATTLVSLPQRSHAPKAVQKISRSQDAFVMSPANGSNQPGLMEMGLNADGLAAVGIDRLNGERTMHGPERTSGYDLDGIELQRGGTRIKSGGLWSNYSPTSAPAHRATMSSGGGADGAPEAEREPTVAGSERERSIRRESVATGVSSPEAPSHPHSNLKGTTLKASRTTPEPVTPVVQPPPITEPIAQWRAEALFDYPGAADDPNELSFKKGEQLTIIDKSGKWWEAKNKAGRKGIAPSNYLRLI